MPFFRDTLYFQREIFVYKSKKGQKLNLCESISNEVLFLYEIALFFYIFTLKTPQEKKGNPQENCKKKLNKKRKYLHIKISKYVNM